MQAQRLVQTSNHLFLTKRIADLLEIIQKIQSHTQFLKKKKLSKNTIVRHTGQCLKDLEKDCELRDNEPFRQLKLT